MITRRDAMVFPVLHAAVVKVAIKQIIWLLLPLDVRIRLARWISNRRWIPHRHRWSMTLIKDYSKRNPDAYHRFLWSNHLGYARLYENVSEFGKQHFIEIRRLFFANLAEALRARGIDPAKDIRSVLDIGCSKGYHLRYMETDLFPSATRLEGIDIDRYAIEEGTAYLRSQESIVKLICGDIIDAPGLFRDEQFDIIISAGLLMYLREDSAARLIRWMLDHARIMVGIVGEAYSIRDNRFMNASTQRADGAFIHNFDSMVTAGGGKIDRRVWGGKEMIEGYTNYWLLCSRSDVRETVVSPIVSNAPAVHREPDREHLVV
jgi:SAM-dependent methyltransferase